MNHENGIKFEVFLEKIIKEAGYSNVLRNVVYKKSKLLYRQIDISYNIIKRRELKLVIVEAKYTTKNKIPYDLREGVKIKKGQTIKCIDSLIAETYERNKFVGSDYSILATNKYFDNKTRTHAKKLGIKILERPSLTAICEKLGLKKDIESLIDSIDSERYDHRKNLIYL
jgi:hypothetical protein